MSKQYAMINLNQYLYRQIIFLICFLVYVFPILSGTNIPNKYSVSYFSTRNEIESGLVNGIIQDHKGLLWFATWNGLYRFDGYDFKHYQSSEENNEGLTNYRLLNIQEDKYGYLWTLSYDSTCYRFHPDKEIFETIRHKSLAENIHNIIIFPNGIVWVFHSGGRATRITTNPTDYTLTFNEAFKNEKINIHSIFMDSHHKEWVLTNKGIYTLSESGVLLPFKNGNLSNDNISCHSIFEINNNLIFGFDKGKIFTYSPTDQSVNYKQMETESSIISIQKLQENLVYVTDRDGFFIEDKKQIRHVELNNLKQLKDKTIQSAQTTSNGLLWLTHPESGVTWYNSLTQELNFAVGLDENNKPIRTDTDFFVIEDINGILWVHPKGGGFSYYDTQSNKLIPFNATEHAIKWKSNDRCYAAFSDKQGNLWMSSQLNRLKRISFIPNKFNIYTPNPLDIDLPENDIRAVFIDKKDRVWCGNRNSDITIYDPDLQLLTQFKIGKAYAITEDSEGVFWISTKGEGLVRVEEKGNLDFQKTYFRHNPKNIYSLSNDNIYYTFQDSKKRLWIATYGGGLNIAQKMPDGSFRFINNSNLLMSYPIEKFNKLRHITEDQDGNIWISTTAGILYVDGDFKSVEQLSFQQISKEQGNTKTLSYNDVHMIKCMRNGKIFAITYGGGINEIIRTQNTSFQCIPFTHKNGLISDIVYSAQEDSDGNLWLITAAGLVKFITSQNQILYPNNHIAFNMHFNEGISPTNGKQIYIGTNRGIFYFTPRKIESLDFTPRIFFSSIWVNNEEQASSSFENGLDNTTQVILPPNNHSLRIVFSALDMTDTKYIQYAYMLEGFDKSYRVIEDSREANYTNLPHGKYIFRVKSTNQEGVWMDNERVLSIEVLPTFVETTYAKILFIIIGILFIIGVFYIYSVFFRMKQKVRNEEFIAQLKLNFFTDISHELRTPLTLITVPLDVILKGDNLPSHIRTALYVIKKNSDRMLRLVEQILDFSKIQGDKMQLRVQQINIIHFTKEIISHFTSFAKERHIILDFSNEYQNPDLWVDSEKIEKVIFNILSNAFKYTPDYTTISINVVETETAISVRITDQGIGIPKDKQSKIFDRFENLIQKNLHVGMSSGIGLSLAKEFVEMHRGSIYVESEPGKGSTFFIDLLKGKDHYPTETEYILTDLKPGEECPIVLEYESEEILDDTDTQRMLIVEDNHELRMLMKQIFQEKYRIIEAFDGNDGLKKAFTFLPDIIITDVMMPMKNGIQMLQELKDDERTSHIPTIVLTAKSNMDSILAGIRTGADDYITKPFSVDYLQEKVNHLLEKQKKLQSYYGNHITGNEQIKEDVPQLSDKDSAFLSRLSEIIDEEMDNTKLNVDFIVNSFNLSRTNFFHKLKSLTGLSPINYIIEKRMKKAAELIKEQKYSMAEIAYMVGYSDPHYFSKSFKAFWKITATEYAKSQSIRSII